MNAPNSNILSELLAAGDATETGLQSPLVVDRVGQSIRLLIGLVAGFGACTPVDTIRNLLDELGSSDARLVLKELSDKHERARKDIEEIYPDLLYVLKKKVA